MKLITGVFFVAICLVSCSKENKDSIVGTWELISATSTENDSTVSTFNPKCKMIKIINETHFAFLNHNLKTGKDTANAVYTAGGGKYTLKDSIYTEQLDYFINREWENNKFEFVVKITGDTLVQQGIEKIDNLGVDHVIVEKYKRVK